MKTLSCFLFCLFCLSLQAEVQVCVPAADIPRINLWMEERGYGSNSFITNKIDIKGDKYGVVVIPRNWFGKFLEKSYPDKINKGVIVKLGVNASRNKDGKIKLNPAYQYDDKGNKRMELYDIQDDN